MKKKTNYWIFVVIILIFYWYVQYHTRILLILPYLKYTDRILDFGCGQCCNTQFLNDKGYDAIGIDVVNKGTCYNPEVYDGHHINYPDNYFDVTICNYVLHHIPHYTNILKELQRVTKRLLIITEDTPVYSFDKFLCSIHAHSEWGKCNKCFLSTKEWVQLFKRMNIGIEKQHNISRFNFPFAVYPIIYPVPRTLFVLSV